MHSSYRYLCFTLIVALSGCVWQETPEAAGKRAAPRKLWEVQGEGLNSIAIRDDVVIAGSYSGAVCAFDARTGASQGRVELGSPVSDVGIDTGGVVRVVTPKELVEFARPLTVRSRRALRGDGSQPLLTISNDASAVLLNTISDGVIVDRVGQSPSHFLAGQGIWQATISCDARRLIVHQGTRLSVMSTDDGVELASRDDVGFYRSIARSAGYVALGGEDGRLTLLSGTLALIAEWSVGRTPVTAIGLLGDLVVCGTSTGELTVWSIDGVMKARVELKRSHPYVHQIISDPGNSTMVILQGRPRTDHPLFVNPFRKPTSRITALDISTLR